GYSPWTSPPPTSTATSWTSPRPTSAPPEDFLRLLSPRSRRSGGRNARGSVWACLLPALRPPERPRVRLGVPAASASAVGAPAGLSGRACCQRFGRRSARGFAWAYMLPALRPPKRPSVPSAGCRECVDAEALSGAIQAVRWLPTL